MNFESNKISTYFKNIKKRNESCQAELQINQIKMQIEKEDKDIYFLRNFFLEKEKADRAELKTLPHPGLAGIENGAVRKSILLSGELRRLSALKN